MTRRIGRGWGTMGRGRWFRGECWVERWYSESGKPAGCGGGGLLAGVCNGWVVGGMIGMTGLGDTGAGGLKRLGWCSLSFFTVFCGV